MNKTVYVGLDVHADTTAVPITIQNTGLAKLACSWRSANDTGRSLAGFSVLDA